MSFVTSQVVELSTAHITRADGRLLEEADTETPFISGYDPRGFGTWFYVPQKEVWAQIKGREKLARFGFSNAFCDLFEAVVNSEIASHLHFDRDNEITEEFSVFEW